jgi:tetratricopeptide (TPR) repeat protein
MRRYLLLAMLSVSLTLAHAQSGSLGTVNFETSCAPAVRVDFNHAVALLYSFEYDESGPAFAAVLQKDPNCAMAAWGQAMSRFHGLWGEYNPDGAKLAAEARRIAAANPATTAREKQYIAAISEIFSEQAIQASHRDDNKPDASGYLEPDAKAEQAYLAKMAELHKIFPQDDEGTIFYALALDTTADRKDRSHVNEKQCTALLTPLMSKYPNHPGVAHYLVHCNDNPEMAEAGLPAARVYAKIAPASAHATHMPSHIFAQLGLWDEMIASNRLSLKAAEADTAASPCQRIGNTFHSMHFLSFALLQEGQLKESQGVLAQAHKLPSSVAGGDKCGEDDGLILAMYVLETGDWKRAADINGENQNGFVANAEWMAVGIAAANTGDDARAAKAETSLKTPGNASGAHASHGSNSEIARLAVASARAHAAGKKDEAEKLARDAADMQDHLGSAPSVFMPMREMLATMLLEDGKSEDALQQYELVLKRQPNRFNSVYGAGSAAYAAGNKALASRYYKQLTKMAPGDERKELAVARERAGSEVAGK